MRRLELYVDQILGDFVENLRSPSKLTLPDLVQNDTIELAVTKLARTEPDSLDAYKVEPWSFSEIRASIGLVDAAPDEGSFKLRVVGVGDTATITWPTDLTTSGIATWKAAVIVALNAVAGANAARLDEPAKTPVNFLYISWTAPGDVREIQVVSVALVPPIDTSDAVRVLQSSPKQQLVKLAQLPIVEQNVFIFPAAPVPTIEPSTTGATGVNEVQLLLIPAQAVGAFDLAWLGSHTAPLAVTGLTAALVATALNATVPAGASNPSFRVEARGARRFAIVFIGPLAAADQPLLTVTPRDQTPLNTAIGTLPLTSARFERALNGAASVKLKLELVIVDAGGESTILRDLTLINDMTGPGTAGSAEEQGAVLIVHETIYIDNSTLTPFASVAPGGTFQPPAAVAAGVAINIAHGLNTLTPFVRIFYEDSLSPARWRELSVNAEFGCEAVGLNNVEITFPFPLTNTPGDDTYRLRYRLFIASPDAILEIFGNIKMTWDQVLDTLPDGQSVRAKFAEIIAMIGQLDGSLLIPPTSIDLAALIKAILALLASNPVLNQLFVNLLTTVITNQQIITAILTTITTNATLFQTFVELLIKTFENDILITRLVEAFFKNSTFLEEFRKLVIEAFQLGGTLPPGFIPFAFEDWELIVPPIHEYDGPSAEVVTGSIDVTTIAGGTTTKESFPRLAHLATARLKEFALLPAEIVAFNADATIAGTVKLTDLTDGHTRNASAAVDVRTIGSRRGASFPAGTVLGRKNGIVFPVRVEGGNAWPVEMERSFFPIQLDDGALYLDARFALNFTLQTQLLGNAQGRIDFVVESGTFSHEGVETRDINAFTWAALLTRPLPLTEALTMMSVAIAITRQTSVALGAFTADPATDFVSLAAHGRANGDKVRFTASTALPAPLVPGVDYFVRDGAADTFKVAATLGGAALDLTTAGSGLRLLYARDVRAGTITLHGQNTTTFVVPALPFALRCWLKNFDAENIAAARGAFIARVKSPAGSIAKLV